MLLYFLKYAHLYLILISARYHHYVTLIIGSLHCLHSSESTHLLSGGGSFIFLLGCCLLAPHTLLQRYLLACVRSRRCPSGIRHCSNELVRTRLSPSSISLHHFCVFGPCMLCHTWCFFFWSHCWLEFSISWSCKQWQQSHLITIYF